jgi:argininosuccinate lyase
MNQEQALWSGGFSEGMHPVFAALSDGLLQDLPLAEADIRASAAYARALGRCGVLTPAESETLSGALYGMGEDFKKGVFVPSGVEDIHTAIEQEVTRRVGALGEKLHTGRSRNDQVSTAFRLALSERLKQLRAALRRLQGVLVQRAEAEMDTLLPSYTHMQRAQPVRLSHWLMGFFWPVERDIGRLEGCLDRVLRLPLGSGAVTGHSFGLDREALARELGFVGVTENSLDAVGDRDFALESACVASMVAVHLSRLAEELVVWSTAEFGYVVWPDALSSGSSLMPNKKNPDVAELVRGKTAAVLGDMTALWVLLKGLPSGYQRDLQEDKPPVWRMFDHVVLCVDAMTVSMSHVVWNRERMGAALSDDVLATEAADMMVDRGVPFRQAHHRVARMVAEAKSAGVGIRALRGSGVHVSEPLTYEDLESLTMENTVERKTSYGGTARSAVLVQMAQAKNILQGASCG